MSIDINLLIGVLGLLIGILSLVVGIVQLGLYFNDNRKQKQ